MKKKLQKLFYVALLGLATFSTFSCNNDDEGTTVYMTDENHVALQGEDNMRDLGGYVGTDNKRVLYHKLFRSGELSTLTTADFDGIPMFDTFRGWL